MNFVRSKTVAFLLRIRVLVLYLIDHDLLGSAKQCPVWSVSSVATASVSIRRVSMLIWLLFDDKF